MRLIEKLKMFLFQKKADWEIVGTKEVEKDCHAIMFKCSECGYETDLWTKHCPNCRAKMY